MISLLLPLPVAYASTGRPGLRSDLRGAEAMVVARAAPRRVGDFAAGRACARAALGLLGCPPAPVLRDGDRRPLWPEGIVGSITHCPGYAAAAVARHSDVRALGIDAERNEPLDDGVLDLVCTPDERAMVACPSDVPLGVLIFSAKESVFKAWSPLTGTSLEHHDAAISFDPDGTFAVELLDDAARRRAAAGGITFVGRYAATVDRVVTTVMVPAA